MDNYNLNVIEEENQTKNLIEKPKIDVEYPSCKQRNWIEFDKG